MKYKRHLSDNGKPACGAEQEENAQVFYFELRAIHCPACKMLAAFNHRPFHGKYVGVVSTEERSWRQPVRRAS